jgi:tetratricopeptide (TPR) repeat protein
MMTNSVEKNEAEIAFEKKVYERSKAILEKTGFPKLHHYESALRNVLAEEILILDPSSKERKVAENLLMRGCLYSGFGEDESKEYIAALCQMKGEECKRIVLQCAEKFEKAQSYRHASHMYLEAGEFRKAAGLLLALVAERGTNEGGDEFLVVAEMLIQGGEERTKAYADMAENVKRLIRGEQKEISLEIKKAEKDGCCYTGEFDSRPDLYITLGQCLYYAGNKEEAMKAFKEVSVNSPAYEMTGAVYFLEDQNDIAGAIEIQKIIADYDNNETEWMKLADLHSKLGQTKEQANAMWMAGKRIEAARLAYSITQDKTCFLKAAEAYSRMRSYREPEFFTRVWSKAEYWRLSEPDPHNDPDPHAMHDKKTFERKQKALNEKRLESLHELFTFVYLAHSLPAPAGPDKSMLSLSKEECKKTAGALWEEFGKRKGKDPVKKRTTQLAKKMQSIKAAESEQQSKQKQPEQKQSESPGSETARKKAPKTDLKALLSEPLLAKAFYHAVLAGVADYEINRLIRWAFIGMPRKRPVESTLTPALLKMWRGVVGSNSFDPVEAAGRAYEEGGYFKEAQEKYLKANLSDDAKRMDALIAPDGSVNTKS